MDADRQAFLAGNVLPLPAHVKTLEVPTGNQGIPSKLQQEHGEAMSHVHLQGDPSDDPLKICQNMRVISIPHVTNLGGGK